MKRPSNLRIVSHRHSRRLRWVGVPIVALGLFYIVPATAQQQVHRDNLHVFTNHFGESGLMLTPSARMADQGELAFTFSDFDPYQNYAFKLQPFDWMEGGFRYTSISNRSYGAVAPDRDYLDKGVNLKLRLIDEGRYRPDLAVGFRDFGGTGLFGGEYLVASKRWYDFDFSLGLGWGYLGARQDFTNPLSVVSDSYRDRIDRDTDSQGGDFNLNQLFSGSVAVFGGIQYRTPWSPLTLMAEYEGNDYQNEPLGNELDQASPVNVGARLRVTDNLSATAALERGNTAMFGVTLRTNIAKLVQPTESPNPIAPRQGTDHETENWDRVAARLNDNAGIAATRISRDGDTITVEGIPVRYRLLPESELRANRILHNASGPEITQFKYRWKSGGMVMREDTLPRAPLPDEPIIVDPASPLADMDYRRYVTASTASDSDAAAQSGETLHDASVRGFSWSAGPDLQYNYGGPDGTLYKLMARVDAEYDTDDNGFLTARLGYELVDNLDDADYLAPSELPRVRSNVVEYLRETELGIYNLQYTRTAQLSKNWFGMAYAGLLEMMYAGAGGEVLYRPFNSPVAFGVDANWVRQRDYETQFGLRDYDVWVGNATTYWDTGWNDVLARVSVGRYLAGDVGATFDFSREFDNGARIGAYATFTDAGDDYGEGSFNKGIYMRIPIDLFSSQSTRAELPLDYTPLTRDGGAKLFRKFSLYSFTSPRALEDYWDNYETASE